MDLRDYIKKTPIKAVLAALTVFFAVYIIWIFPITHALNTYLNNSTIETLIKNKTNIYAQINSISYKTHPDFSLSIITPEFKIIDNNEEILNIKEFSTRINLLSLAFNKINIQSLQAESLKTNIIKNKNGEINILKLIPIKKTKSNHLKISNTNLNQYNIFYTDEVSDEAIQLNGSHLLINKYIQNKYINLETKGKIKSIKNKNIAQDAGAYDIKINSSLPIKKNLNKKDFDLKLNIQNLNLKPLSIFSKELHLPSENKLSGTINSDIETIIDEGTKKLVGNIQTNNIILTNNTPEFSSYLKEKAKIEFNTNLLKNNIFIEKLTFTTQNHKISAKGHLFHTNTTKPLIDINVDIYNSEKSMIYNLLPSELKFENNLISKIKKYQPIATLSGNLTLKGNITNPDIIGEIKAKDLYINQELAKKAIAQLTIIFDKRRMHLNGTVVPNKGTQIDVNGSLNIYGEKNATFDIKSTPNASLPIIRAVLLPIQDTFSLNFGILNHLLINSGYGEAEIKTSGTRKNSQLYGNLKFYDAQAQFKGINAVFDNASGQVDFNGKNINFKTNDAKLKKQKIDIWGTAQIHGNFDININSPEIKTNTLLEIIKTSDLLTSLIHEYKEINYINKIIGNTNLKLNIQGNAQNTDIFNNIDKLNYNSTLNIKNNTIILNNFAYPINVNTSNITIKPNTFKAIINGKILNSLFNLDTNLDNENIQIFLTSDKLQNNDLIKLIDKQNQYTKLFANAQDKTFTKIKGNYKNKGKDIDLQKIVLEAELFSEDISPFYTSQGSISLNNGNLNLDKVNLNVLNSRLIIDGLINNLFDKKSDYDINCELNNFDIATLNNIQNYKVISEDIKKIITAYEKYNGKINGNLNIKNSAINGKITVKDIALTQKKMQLPISISNADIIFKDDLISIPTIHGTLDNIPVLIKLDIKNYFKKAIFDGYITTNLYQNFINKYINTNLGYPIKLKGEVQLKTYFKGNKDAIKSTTVLNFPINSDISYMGASLDDKEFEREIKIEMMQNSNIYKINKATLSKNIRSLNGVKTKYPYVSVSGSIKTTANDLIFNNFNIKTNEKTNSKIFNILFKKSILKYGKFDCDLVLNGTYTKPNIIGYINFKNLDMPLYETIIKDIFATFKQNTIDLKVFGSVYDTDITAMATAKNNIELPFHIKTLDIHAGYLDLDNIFNSLSVVSMKKPNNINDSEQNELQKNQSIALLIDKGQISAEKVLVREFPATNLSSKITLDKNNILYVKDFNFDFAKGSINTNGSYNFNTDILEGECIAKGIDANQFSQIFLNLKNQIFGTLDGVVIFNTNGTTPEQRLKNLNGKIDFKISDGKMPKLGSLEYLLRAANLIKSGLTGFTINNMVDLLIPVKTGDFSFINGNIILNNGKAQNIEISSMGKNLSLYITGSADIVEQNAQMVVLGRLSKKLSTILGPIGNASLNTLFNFIPGLSEKEKENIIIKELNKIPFLELSNNNDYRFFQATIDGNLNTDEFVQTFKWLE